MPYSAASATASCVLDTIVFPSYPHQGLEDPPPRAGGGIKQKLQINDTGAKAWEEKKTSNLKDNKHQHEQKVRELAGEKAYEPN
jgi:hypothetical protein